jgi:hypothetical protein
MRRKLSLSRGPGKAQILLRHPQPSRGARMFTSGTASTVIVIALTSACATHPAQRAPAAPGGGLLAASAPAPAPGRWRILFDGRNLDAWRGYQKPDVPPGWNIVNGTLAKNSPVADIMSKDEFGDFELEMEWKIGEAGNSGIFYRATEEYDHIYWSGPEYQLLDDIKAPDGKDRLTSAGSAYGLYPSPEGHLKPVGEWNRMRIVVRGAHVEHWLNDFKLLEYEFWSPDWEAKVKASKFGAWPNYGRARKGHIGMQGDHTGVLAFRNIRIREL